MTLQKSVGVYPALAVEGDFASTNPRATAVNNNGGFISDGTVTVGGFAWADGRVLSGIGTGLPDGFVSRNSNFAYIQNFDSSTLTINKGVETTIHTAGDFYIRATTSATKGQKVFASTKDGSVLAGDTGSTVTDAVETNFKFTQNVVAGGLAIISTY